MFKGIYCGFIVSMFLSIACFAQPPAETTPPGGDPPDPRVPISGIEWLLIGGGLLGARKAYAAFKKK
jgi:hypothetical protein